MRQLTNASGAVNLAQSFDPTGSPTQRAGAEATTYGWAGEQSDANGLVYLRARFYAPGMGRFLNTDPSRQEMNPYQYAMGKPVLFTDPSGLAFCIGAAWSTPEANDCYPDYSRSLLPIVFTSAKTGIAIIDCTTSKSPLDGVGPVGIPVSLNAQTVPYDPATWLTPEPTAPPVPQPQTNFGPGAVVMAVGECGFGSTNPPCISANWSRCAKDSSEEPNWHCGIDILPVGGGAGSAVYSPVDGEVLLALNSQPDEWGNKWMAIVRSGERDFVFVHIAPRISGETSLRETKLVLWSILRWTLIASMAGRRTCILRSKGWVFLGGKGILILGVM